MIDAAGHVAGAYAPAVDLGPLGRVPVQAPALLLDGLALGYYAAVARLIGAALPRFVPPLPGSPQSERSAVSRRVSNARMRQVLDVTLQYPSYQEGLAAILGA